MRVRVNEMAKQILAVGCNLFHLSVNRFLKNLAEKESSVVSIGY